jgi:hypothetical protein
MGPPRADDAAIRKPAHHGATEISSVKVENATCISNIRTANSRTKKELEQRPPSSRLRRALRRAEEGNEESEESEGLLEQENPESAQDLSAQ